MNRRKRNRVSEPVKRQYQPLSLVAQSDSYAHNHSNVHLNTHLNNQSFINQSRTPHTPVRDTNNAQINEVTPLSNRFEADPYLLHDDDLLLINDEMLEEQLEQRRSKRRSMTLYVPETPMTVHNQSYTDSQSHQDIIPCSLESSCASASCNTSYNTSVSCNTTVTEGDNEAQSNELGPVARVLSYPLLDEEEYPSLATLEVEYEPKPEQSVDQPSFGAVKLSERERQFEAELDAIPLSELLVDNYSDDEYDYFERNHIENRSASVSVSASPENNQTQSTQNDSQAVTTDSLSSDFDEDCPTQIVERPWHEATPVTQPIDPVTTPQRNRTNHSEGSTQPTQHQPSTPSTSQQCEPESERSMIEDSQPFDSPPIR